MHKGGEEVETLLNERRKYGKQQEHDLKRVGR